jgi:hypothetical protein
LIGNKELPFETTLLDGFDTGAFDKERLSGFGVAEHVTLIETVLREYAGQ